MDHVTPPNPIDGVDRATFSLRDLASGAQLAWRPVPDQTVPPTAAVLNGRIRKSDNTSYGEIGRWHRRSRLSRAAVGKSGNPGTQYQLWRDRQVASSKPTIQSRSCVTRFRPAELPACTTGSTASAASKTCCGPTTTPRRTWSRSSDLPPFSVPGVMRVLFGLELRGSAFAASG